MPAKVCKWALGLTYVVVVATIWTAFSFVVKFVVGSGVSPFLVTYICNSVFVILIPIVEIGRYLEESVGNSFWWLKKSNSSLKTLRDSEALLLGESSLVSRMDGSGPSVPIKHPISQNLEIEELECESKLPAHESELESKENIGVSDDANKHLGAKGHWKRSRVAKVSLLIGPFLFLAQLAFNLSLKYTTVTSNTIISSTSSLFTFLISVTFVGERFTWIKLFSVLLCMGGTITVSLGDKESGSTVVASNPLLGDALTLISACFYAVYITLVRKKLLDGEDNKEAVLLTTATVATAGLTIQVPLAAIFDSVTGHAPHLLNYIGAVLVLLGFAGINIPSNACCSSSDVD